MQIKQRRLFWNAYYDIYNLHICPKKRFNIYQKVLDFFKIYAEFVRIHLAIFQIIDLHFILSKKGDYSN